MALASSETVLGCNDIQLRQLSAPNTAAAASSVSQVTCSQCLPFTITHVQNCLQHIYSADSLMPTLDKLKAVQVVDNPASKPCIIISKLLLFHALALKCFESKQDHLLISGCCVPAP